MPDIFALVGLLLPFVVIGYGIYWIVRMGVRAELANREKRPPGN